MCILYTYIFLMQKCFKKIYIFDFLLREGEGEFFKRLLRLAFTKVCLHHDY